MKMKMKRQAKKKGEIKENRKPRWRRKMGKKARRNPPPMTALHPNQIQRTTIS
jgi:hypothetical protein